MKQEGNELWNHFLSTGSVDDYLRFKQQVQPEGEQEKTSHADCNAGAGASGSEIS